MTKLRYVLFLLVPFIFLGCPILYSDDDNDFYFTYEVEKTEYKKDESITLNYQCNFKDDDTEFRIFFSSYKIIDDNLDYEYLPAIHFEQPENISPFGNRLYYINIKRNENVTSLKDSIVFSISEPGTYRINVQLDKCTKGVLDGYSTFITITE
ncbi:MAG: hypothetical protein SO116_02780 [Treponema sp.]|nr:hypothetical protein [Treponema sp.]